MQYAELHCRTWFSFLEGASRPEELLARARDIGLSALAVTDENGLHGVVETRDQLLELCGLSGKAKEPDTSPRLIYGSELRFHHPDEEDDFGDVAVALARTRTGYANLSQTITDGRRAAEKGEFDLSLETLASRAEGLTLLAGGPSSLPMRLLVKGFDREAEARLGALREVFGDHLYVELVRHIAPGDRERSLAMARLATRLGIPVVATNDVRFHERSRKTLHDVLRCIREGCTLRDAGRRLMPNGEAHLKTPRDMAALFADLPEAIENTVAVAQSVEFRLCDIKYRPPSPELPRGETDDTWLQQLSREGLRRRLGDLAGNYAEKLEHEFEIIRDLGYAGYFLIMEDIVRECRDRGILCQGRGSAANSLVCFALDITSVRPDVIDMLFERFLSRERNEPPDIDLDIEHERREEIIQYVYAKYGRDHAGMVAEVIRYRHRSALRDVGKVLGFSPEQLARLSRFMSHGFEENTRAFAAAGIDTENPMVARLFDLAKGLYEYPRHLSIHVGGFILSEEPLTHSVPIENGRMEERTVIQWNKDDVDSMGMFKLDLLGLGMLTVLAKSFAMIAARLSAVRDAGDSLRATLPSTVLPPFILSGVSAANAVEGPSGQAIPHVRSSELDRKGPDHSLVPVIAPQPPSAISTSPSTAFAALTPLRMTGGGTMLGGLARQPPPQAVLALPESGRNANSPRLTLQNIPPGDEPTYAMLRDADSVGVFQVESRAQMSMLPRLKPYRFYDLVIEVAIVRPGPIQGGMVHPYLRRRDGLETPDYPHPKLHEVLHRTLGVPLFQEQVIRLAMAVGGYSPGEADQLRRDMASWRASGRIARHRERLMTNMMGNGLTLEYAERIFKQLEGFGAYGFPESHAAAFAHLAYVSAYLKRHYPAEFAAALINSQPMGFYSPSVIVSDVRRHGVEIRPIDVDVSVWDCTIEEGAIRLGLRMVRGLGEEAGKAIVSAREVRRFVSMEDLRHRAGLDERRLTALAAAGALRRLGNRREALWKAMARAPGPLFDGIEQPEPEASLPPLPPLEELRMDAVYGSAFPEGHPMQHVRAALDADGVLPASGLRGAEIDRQVRVAGLVITRQRPGNGNIVYVTLEDETGHADCAVPLNTFRKFEEIIRLSPALVIRGKLQGTGDARNIAVSRVWPLAIESLPTVPSHDFH